MAYMLVSVFFRLGLIVRVCKITSHCDRHGDMFNVVNKNMLLPHIHHNLCLVPVKSYPLQSTITQVFFLYKFCIESIIHI